MPGGNVFEQTPGPRLHNLGTIVDTIRNAQRKYHADNHRESVEKAFPQILATYTIPYQTDTVELPAQKQTVSGKYKIDVHR